MTPSTAGKSVRTIWFGMRCAFTRAALEGAIAAGDAVTPVAAVLPRGPKPASAGWPEPPLDRWLRERGIEIVEVGRLTEVDLAAIERLVREREIPLGAGACFPWKVPAQLRSAIRCGVLNIHPSLLPALRGPEPVFHAYRLGLEATGVTVHLMDDGWDSGPIVAQTRVAIPDDGRADAFEAELARRGGEMLAGIAHQWCAGTLDARPQDDARASWAPVPGPTERHMLRTLTVAQARRFLSACPPLTATDADTGVTVAVAGVAARGEVAVRVRCRDGDLWVHRIGTNGVANGTGGV
ncbi:MAG TPA: formyltransferase family protein [Thermomicrobiales bacterium]|nr:formyltransferase family protein [Thermomicrobiales bacterium]